jgi:molybdate transport system substrate-binding protein
VKYWREAAIAGFAGVIGCGRGTVATSKLNVFAAASLAEPFSDLGKRYEQAHPGLSVTFNFAGSNVLRLQIEQHSPADIFASANQREMKALLDDGLLNPDSIHVFAGNRLTIIVPASNPAKLITFADLAKPGLKLIAADKAVPAGAYFERALQRASELPEYGHDFGAKVLANVRSREENVEAVVTKVRLGVADAGIAYQSDMSGSASAALRGIEIPATINPAAQYPIATLSQCSHSAAAGDFESFVLSPQGQAVLTGHGFLPAPTR